MKLLLPFIILSFCLNSCKSDKAKESPNIVLIMSDDMGWFDTGFNGNDSVHTPYLDEIASKGVIFDRFYSGSAVCSPTRASFLTGRNPLRTDVPYANEGHLRKEEITIAELLAQKGYVSGHFGKWHLGTLTQTEKDANRGGKEEFLGDYTIPTEHGYDVYFCTESKVPTYDPMLYPTQFIEGESKRFGWRAIGNKDSSAFYGTSYWSGPNQKVENNLQGEDSEIIMDRVIPFIEEATEKEQPFLTVIWLHSPHLPVVSDSLHRSQYNDLDLEKQLYYGTITALDEQIGRLWSRLEELQVRDNTIFFYCSDNGPEVNTPGSAGKYRGRKRSLYEGGVRVPAFLVWPNQLKPGKRIDYPVVTSDLLPTIMDITNIKYPDNRPIDGVSILDAMLEKKSKREKPIGFICRPHISWVTDQYKLVGDMNQENFELYDLIADPSEQTDIITENPALAEKMKKELNEWLASVQNSTEGKDY